MENESKFEFEGNKYKVIMPTRKIREQSDSVYAKTFRAALADNYMLESEVDEILEQRGLSGETYDKKKTDLLKEMRQLEAILVNETYKSPEEGKSIALSIRKVRDKLEAIEKPRLELNQMTANSRAESRRFNYYAYACVRTDSGDKIWTSYQDYENDESDFAYVAANEVLKLMYSMTAETLDDMTALRTENIWLKNKGFVNDDMYFIDKDGNTVDSEGRRINEKGQYIDEDGNFIDKFGNALDENGKLIKKEKVSPSPKSKPKVKKAKPKPKSAPTLGNDPPSTSTLTEEKPEVVKSA